MAAALQPEENIVWSDFRCHLAEHDNSCVRCIYEKGEFYSNDGENGKCILKKVQVTKSYVEIRRINFKCTALALSDKEAYDTDPECSVEPVIESDEVYVGKCLSTRLSKAQTNEYTSKISSFGRCKGSNWRPNVSDAKLAPMARHCESNPTDCKFSCRDFDIKDKDKDIDGEKIPCAKDGWETRTEILEMVSKNADGVEVIEQKQVMKKVCV